jgi:electron transfer flavoprotein beta subunit
LAAAIKKVGEFDLILSGRQASDTDAGQVPLGVAELLGLPSVAPVIAIERTGDGLTVNRLTDDGQQVIEVGLPALLAVSSEIGEPRYPPLRGIMAAGRAKIPEWTAADLGVAPSARKATLRRLFVEQREAKVDLIEADSPEEAGVLLANRLREAKLI